MAGQFIYYKLLKPEAAMTVYEHGAEIYATKVCGDQRFQTQHYGNSGNSIAEGRAERIS